MNKKILSLDLGITSIGYSVLDEIEKNQYIFIDQGIVMRDAPFDKRGVSTQSEYSKYKGQTSLLKKKKRRVARIAEIFEEYNLLNKVYSLQIQRENIYNNRWELRAKKAFDALLSKEEMFSIFAHMAKHRGYKSIATEDLLWELEEELGLEHKSRLTKEKAQEQSEQREAINRLIELRKKNQEKTVAQVIDMAVKKGIYHSYRNHENYEKMIRREDIEDEIKKILNVQYKKGFFTKDKNIVENFSDDIIEAIVYQEESIINPELFGKCSYYENEKVAPKFSYLYDYYKLYKHIGDLRIDNYTITKEDRIKIVNFVEDKIAKGLSISALKYKDVIKILGLNNEQKIFGIENRSEMSNDKKQDNILVKFSFFSKIKPISKMIKAIESSSNKLIVYQKIADIMQQNKNPKKMYSEINTLLIKEKIEFENYKEILFLLVERKEPGSLSISHKFILDALPYFIEGYSEAEVKNELNIVLNEDYSSFPKGIKYLTLGKNNLFEKYENNINNHAVKSLASWSLGLIADLSNRYGIFDEIILETTRNALPQRIKDDIQKAINRQTLKIDKILNEYKEEFPNITRNQARKIDLWLSQDKRDIYTGATINMSMIFNGEVDYEHIVPQNLGGLWVKHNIILAIKNDNLKKSNRLPMDYFQESKEYKNRVIDLFSNGFIDWKKKKNLLALNLDEVHKDITESKSLRATSYLEALVGQVLKMFYPFREEKHRKDGNAVRLIPGKTTSKARNLFSIKSKSRDTNFHHAEDALILGTLSRGWQQRIHRIFRENYGKSEKELNLIWKDIYPHIEGLSIKDFMKESFERFMSKGEESIFYKDMKGNIRTISYWVNKKPLSASSHKDKVYSDKYKKDNKILPVLRKNILDEFKELKILDNLTRWNSKDFKEVYIKKLRDKLFLHEFKNYNDATYIAIENRAKDIEDIFLKYELLDLTDKEYLEALKEEMSLLLNRPIYANGKEIRRVKILYKKLNYFKIDRGLVETDKNFLALKVIANQDRKITILRVDVNSQHMHFKNMSNAIKVYLNDVIFVFSEDKILQYGALRSFIESGKRKKIALFNPRFPSNPGSQPKKFSTRNNKTTGQIKQIDIGKATGIIKLNIDFTGTIKSYQKIGVITEEEEKYFLEESKYGSMEKHTYYQTL